MHASGHWRLRKRACLARHRTATDERWEVVPLAMYTSHSYET